MKIDDIKKQMKEYTDFFGGQLINHSEIDKAETEIELERIIDKHHDYISDMANDAQNSLDRWRRTLNFTERE